MSDRPEEVEADTAKRRVYLQELRHAPVELLHSHSGRGWLVLDFLFGFGAAVAAFYLSGRALRLGPRHLSVLGGGVLWGTVLCISAQWSGLHRPSGTSSKYETVVMVGVSVALAVMIESVLLLTIVYYRLGRVITTLQVAISFSGLILMRMLFVRWLERHPKRLALYSPDGRHLDRLIEVIENRVKGYHIVAISSDTTNKGTEQRPMSSDTSNRNDLLEMCKKRRVHEFVYCRGKAHSAAADSRVLELLRAGVPVSTPLGFFERVFFQTPIDYLSNDWPVSGLAPALRDSYRHLRRGVDIAVAIVLGIALMPVCLLGAAAVRIFLGRPVIYRQPRVSLRGRIFRIYKFRTMRNDEDDTLKERFAQAGDPRVPFVGRILRRTRIDELPQLLNILKGDMVLIGPRPEQPGFAAHYEKELPFYGYRHLVRPGITGWAQVRHRYTNDLEGTRQKLGYDLYYIRHMNLKLDLEIVLRTIVSLMKGAV